MRIETAIGIGIWIGACLAQGAGERASLWIILDESGRQNSYLGLSREAPAGLAEGFAEAVGCRAADLTGEAGGGRGTYRPEVTCASPSVREGLQARTRWPLSRLNGVMGDLGGLDIYVSHPGAGVARITPEAESRRSLYGWSHHGTAENGAIPDVVLETGFEERGAWVLLWGGVLLALSPLLLMGVTGGLAEIQGGIRWLSVMGGTAWLWAVMATEGPAMTAMAAGGLPGRGVVWAGAAIAVPVLLAVWLGTAIVGPKYDRALPAAQALVRRGVLFWSGIAAAGMLLAVAGIMAGDPMLPLGAAGLFVFLLGIWQRLDAMGGVVTVLGEGPLLRRIGELAEQAGVRLAGVQLIRGVVDVPAAFADHQGRILLSHALLRELPCAEVDAIVAHELSHLRRKHGAAMRGIFLVLPVVLGVNFFVPGVVTWAVWLVPLVFFGFMELRRRQEFAADADAAALVGGPEPLIRGLERATRLSGVSLDWSRWAGLALAHPPVTARVAALAAAGGRETAVMGSTERYLIPEAEGGGNGMAEIRGKLRLGLGLLSMGFPLAYSVGIPLVFGGGVVAAIVGLCAGVALFYTAYEWMAARARNTARMRAGGTGFFVGISPAAEPLLYDGMFDFEWGFVSFAGEWLVVRGEHGEYAARRDEVTRIWKGAGPASWTAKPMVCFSTVDGRAFSLRPFDGAFGPWAGGAARRLLAAAEDWKAGSGVEGEQRRKLAEYPAAAGVAEPPYTMGQLARAVGQFGMYGFALGSVAQFMVWGTVEPAAMLTSLVIAGGLAVYLSWPGLRRSMLKIPSGD